MSITDKEELIINIGGKTRLFTKEEVGQALTNTVYDTGVDPPLKDSVVEAVREDLLQRSRIGIKKYQVTLDREDLSLRDWLSHAYEECLDQANYLKRAIMKIDNEEKR